MSVEDYRLFFEAHPSPMLIYELGTLRILAANDALCRELGYARSDLLGQSLLMLHAPEDHARVSVLLEPVASGRITGTHRVSRGLRQRRKDGTFIDVESTGQPTTFDGRAARLVTLRDLAVERRARSLEERWAALFERARDVVLLLAHDGRILDANHAAVRAYGYPKDELLRMRILQLREPQTVPDVRRQMDRAEGHGILFETVHRRKDGTPFPVEVSSSGVDLDGERVLLSIIRDITDRRGLEHRAHERIVAVADELERNPERALSLASRLRSMFKP